jgi:hypothetical protein
MRNDDSDWGGDQEFPPERVKKEKKRSAVLVFLSAGIGNALLSAGGEDLWKWTKTWVDWLWQQHK